MATWTDINGYVWEHDSDKMNFDAWIASDPTLVSSWEAACVEHKAWELVNPGVSPTEATGSASAIFTRWITYANVD